jgi:putative DNA primase/helicase
MTEEINLVVEALKYRNEEKFSVIPVKVDKTPAIASWKEFQEHLPTEEEIRKMFARPDVAGIAVITGKISGIVALDCEAAADLSTLKEMPRTRTVSSGGGGKHFYFRYPANQIIPARQRLMPAMDLQSDGRYIILPPSMHQSGIRYEWDFENSIEEFAEMPEWLKKIAGQVQGTSGAQDWKQNAGGVAEGERNTSMARWIGKLLSRFPESEWERFVWPLAVGMNNLNRPPLREVEVRSVYESLRKKESTKRTPTNFMPISVPELLKTVSGGVAWVVEKLFPVGGVNVISGHPGSFKTWVLLHVALKVARGELVFGQFPSKKTKVLIVDEENRVELIRPRLEMLGASSADDGIFISSLANFKIDDRPSMEKLTAFVERHQIGLVIFDSFVRVHSKDENVAREIAEVFEGFKSLAKAGIAVIITHHHRKQARTGKHGMSQSLRGSSDILAAVDTHLAVEYDKEENTLTFFQTKMRVAEAHNPFTVDISSDATSMHLGFTGEADMKKLKADEAQEAILVLFAERPILSREDIIYELQSDGIGKTAIGKALKSLASARTLSVEMGAKGKKTYTLNEEIETQE